MHNAILRYTASNRMISKNVENKLKTRYEALVFLMVSGGLFSTLSGFFLLGVYTFFDRKNTSLNYIGVGLLVAAFAFFASGAHFMDKSDEAKRRLKISESRKL